MDIYYPRHSLHPLLVALAIQYHDSHIYIIYFTKDRWTGFRSAWSNQTAICLSKGRVRERSLLLIAVYMTYLKN